MKNTTKYVRVLKNNNYSVLNNEFIRRDDLSWKAKGILAYILHLPDDWNINLKEVMRHATEGERAFRTGWKELEELGYVKRYPVRKGRRIERWETIVKEKPDMEPFSELCGFEDVQNVHVQNEDVQNSNLLSTKDTKYLREPSTKNNKAVPYKEIIEYLNEKTGKSISYRSNGNKKLIRARINEGYTVEDFKKVIDNKVNDWFGKGIKFSNGKPAENYLHPSTLFIPKNFDKYLNEALAKQPNVSNVKPNTNWKEARYK